MKSYLAFVKGYMTTFIVYRAGFIFTFIGNCVYMGLIYFLWKNIYSGAATLHGMSFNHVFVYLSLAGSLFVLFKTFAGWNISKKIIDGSIIMDLIKPLDFQLQTLFGAIGVALSSLITVTLPSVLVLFLVFGGSLNGGIGLFFFPIGLSFAFLISFALDYVVGLISFYTHSLWGINMTKEVVVSLFSGALVPLQYYPEALRAVVKYLPFQAIYHVPLTLATSPGLTPVDCLSLLFVQLCWVLILFTASRLFFRVAVRVLMVSGG
ncbi:MAG TPA: hypothetical protein ENN69_04000 [Spirochaetia bacterium]|nr:hypothetical protein [Spirochaetia bacterium]